MPIETVDVTSAEIAVGLATEEGHFADIKAIEIAPKKPFRLSPTLTGGGFSSASTRTERPARGRGADWRTRRLQMGTCKLLKRHSRWTTTPSISSCATRPVLSPALFSKRRCKRRATSGRDRRDLRLVGEEQHRRHRRLVVPDQELLPEPGLGLAGGHHIDHEADDCKRVRNEIEGHVDRMCLEAP